MPTKSGWTTLLGSLAVFVIGQVYSLPELVILGTVGMLLPLSSLLMVWLFAPRFTCQRSVQPDIATAEEPIKVHLDLLATKSRSWTLPLAGTDTITSQCPNGTIEHSQVAFITNGRELAYDFDPSQRGMVSFGSLSLTAYDPFYLAKVTKVSHAEGSVLVLPHFERVQPPHPARDLKTWREGSFTAKRGTSEGEFHALKEYVPGDDFRHIHWKSSARHGELLVRQNERTWEAGISIVLDNRQAVASDASFEQMVGAASSLIAACHHHSQPARLYVLAAEADAARRIDSPESYQEALVLLARVDQQAQANPAIEPIGRLVVLTGSLALDADSDLAEPLLTVCQHTGSSQIVTVSFSDQPDQESPALRDGVETLVVPSHRSFGEIWDAHLLTEDSRLSQPRGEYASR